MFCLGSAPPRFVGAESLALIISLPVQSSEPRLNSLAAQKQNRGGGNPLRPSLKSLQVVLVHFCYP